MFRKPYFNILFVFVLLFPLIMPQGVTRAHISNLNHEAVNTSSNTLSDTLPDRITRELHPGESYTEQFQVFTGDTPFNKGDVIFVFDRTGSMGDEISAVQASAINIMNNVKSQLPNTWFGVGSFMDYPGYFVYPGYEATYGNSSSGDVPWMLNIRPTSNYTEVVSSINSLTLGSGNDTPEDYTRALYEVSQVGSVGWRSRAKRIVVLFGDAPTHDLDFAGYNFGGDPGRDGIAQTADDLDFETVVQQVAAQDISVIAVDSGYSADSEATFKGMSIGYGTAAGTNGRYFNLVDASDIPTITVGMIISETQSIDHLYLQPTEGYEDWITVTPTETRNVSANITTTFSVSIEVPEGTQPGYYPFVIQTIGDGAILDISYVEIIVPTDAPVTDLGFRPDNDGFSFANESSTQTWDMFKQFFGTEFVEYPNGNRIYAAEAFFSQYYSSAGSGGSCDGFSALSLINYADLTQANAGQYTMNNYTPLYLFEKNSDMTQAFAFAQAIQMGLEVNSHTSLMCELLGKSPAAFYNYIKTQITLGSPVVVGIRAGQDYYAYLGQKVLSKGDGHALVPYRYEEPTSNLAYVYVYDSNLPGNDEHRIEFDLENDTWSYRWPLPLWPDITIGGDSSTCLLSVTPIEMYLHQGLAWWSIPGFKTALNTENAEVIQTYATDGPARPLFVDAEGRRFGWASDEFYSEIPGAYYFEISHGEEGTDSGFYYFTDELPSELNVIGYAVGQATLSSWSGSYTMQLSNLDVVTGTVVTLSVPANESKITILNTSEPTKGTLSVSRSLESDGRTVSLDNININPEEEISLQATINDTPAFADMIKISTTSPVGHTYNLSLQRAGGNGYSVFGHHEIALSPNSETLIELINWDDLSVITLQNDINRDGTIDYTQEMGNDSQPYALAFEDALSTVKSGKQVALILGVTDQFGAYVADGVEVVLSTSLGELSTYNAVTSGGLVHVTFTAGYTSGVATVTANVGGLQANIEIAIETDQTFLYMPVILRHQIEYAPPAPTPTPTSTPIPYDILNGDFENGSDGNWQEYSSNGFDLIMNSFGTNGLTPHSGSWAVWLGGWPNELSILTQQINVPASGNVLTFYYWGASEESNCNRDVGGVFINNDLMMNIPLCGNTNGWVEAQVNPSAYTNQVVNLRIQVQTNDNDLNSNLFVDDVSWLGSSITSAPVFRQPMANPYQLKSGTPTP